MINKVVVNVFYGDGKLLRVNISKLAMSFLILIPVVSIIFIANHFYKNSSSSLVLEKDKPLNNSTQLTQPLKDLRFPDEIKGSFTVEKPQKVEKDGRVKVSFLLGNSNSGKSQAFAGELRLIHLSQRGELKEELAQRFSFKFRRNSIFYLHPIKNGVIYFQVYIDDSLVQSERIF